MSRLAFIFRDHREELVRRWQASFRGALSDDYREVLESPVGDRLARKVIEDLLAYSEAEEYEAQTILKRIMQEAASEGARRASLGFALDDMLVAQRLRRAALWDTLGDALVVGELPPPGETMEQMKRVDAFLDRLVQAEVRAYLGAAGEGSSAQR